MVDLYHTDESILYGLVPHGGEYLMVDLHHTEESTLCGLAPLFLPGSNTGGECFSILFTIFIL